MIGRYGLVALASAALVWAPPSHAIGKWLKKCREAISKDVELATVGDVVFFDGKPVTGEWIYPVALVLSNLELTEADVLGLKGKKVTSLGEGFSGLLPHLSFHGARATGVDTWYGNRNLPDNLVGELMRQYVVDHGRRLKSADVTEYIPQWPRSQDLVLSHMVVNNLDRFKAIYLIRNALLVTKRGGEIRIFGFEPEYREFLTEALTNIFGARMSFTMIEKAFTYETYGMPIHRTKLLLRILVN